jgi:LuxR family maltose regulon positive regulatory protein
MLTLGVQAMIAARDGATYEAERLAQDAEARSQRHNLSEHFDAFYVHTARGWLSWRQGEYRHARDLFGRALELVRRSSLRVETAEILTALAVTEQKLNHHRSARAHLGEARRLIEECRDPGELLLDPRTVRVAEAHLRPATPLPLSGREAEVLEAVAQGLTSGEIGAHLHLSRRTIEAHLRSIYRKIGVTTRAAAIRYAFRHDLAGESGGDRIIRAPHD